MDDVVSKIQKIIEKYDKIRKRAGDDIDGNLCTSLDPDVLLERREMCENIKDDLKNLIDELV